MIDDKYIYRPRSEGDTVLGSIRPSVCPSVCLSVNALTAEPQFWNKNEKSNEKSHFQSKVFVCVPTNRADAVDRLLILR